VYHAKPTPGQVIGELNKHYNNGIIFIMRKKLYGPSPEIYDLAAQTTIQIADIAMKGCIVADVYPLDPGYPQLFFTYPYRAYPYKPANDVDRTRQISAPEGSLVDVPVVTDTTGLVVRGVEVRDKVSRLFWNKSDLTTKGFRLPFTSKEKTLRLTLMTEDDRLARADLEITVWGGAGHGDQEQGPDPDYFNWRDEDLSPQEIFDAEYIRVFTERTLVAGIVAGVLKRTYGIVGIDAKSMYHLHTDWLGLQQNNPITKLNDPDLINLGMVLSAYKKPQN